MLALLLAGCADVPDGAALTEDPYEQTNRRIFDFNQKLDQHIARPVAKAYVQILPEPARDGVHNVLTNLSQPVVFANELLQGHVVAAGETVGRVAVNSVFGIGGLIDVASKVDLPAHETDLGITLGKWGLEQGPYLVLPLLGPAPPRDMAGKIGDIFLNPMYYVSFNGKLYYEAGLATLNVVDLRARNLDTLDSVERTSIDYYASIRSLYLQHRNGKVNDRLPDAPETPDQ
ncbi:MAG TPA: VacJ family lipoprotein [Rhizomicrobium sp.]